MPFYRLEQDDFRKLLATPRPSRQGEDGEARDSHRVLGARPKRQLSSSTEVEGVKKVKKEPGESATSMSIHDREAKTFNATKTGQYRDRAKERRLGRVDEESIMVEVMEKLQGSSMPMSLPKLSPKAEDDEQVSFSDEDDIMDQPWMSEDVSRGNWKPRASSFRQTSTHRLYEEIMLREAAELGEVRGPEEESSEARKTRQRTLATLPRSVYVMDSEEFQRDPWSKPTTLVRSIAHGGGPVDPVSWGQEEEGERKERKERERRKRLQEEEGLKNGLSLLWRSIRKGERALERRRIREEEEAKDVRDRELQKLRDQGLEDEEGEDIFEDAGRDYDPMDYREKEPGEEMPSSTSMEKLKPTPVAATPRTSSEAAEEESGSLLEQFLQDVETEGEGMGMGKPPSNITSPFAEEDPFHLGSSHLPGKSQEKEESKKKGKEDGKHKEDGKRKERREWQAIERIMQTKYGHTIEDDEDEGK
ncbi:hypothetical protein BJ684DRAFT_14753 [Piptocephalis cylindrospora]|uniref:Uncharacterized protein n=1 Tax=Piptocephalis cylindrospora TaxID=1907219 RepID=A0A4P9Y759_9FUNG|nr:hypothetical protein BJ684DRAFT_14753 [Piptocephalis cylindrospora]|eukprot:RKP14958.1 hypothetical protein BJ684DRAFT_14753 [Piptocephalis cylindrospora]